VIVAPKMIPDGQNSPSIVMEKILAIEREILLINKQEKESMSNGLVRQSQNLSNSPSKWDISMSEIPKPTERKKRLETINEIERFVNTAGKNACVLVPKTWAGKRVRIVLINEET